MRIASNDAVSRIDTSHRPRQPRLDRRSCANAPIRKFIDPITPLAACSPGHNHYGPYSGAGKHMRWSYMVSILPVASMLFEVPAFLYCCIVMQRDTAEARL